MTSFVECKKCIFEFLFWLYRTLKQLLLNQKHFLLFSMLKMKTVHIFVETMMFLGIFSGFIFIYKLKFKRTAFI